MTKKKLLSHLWVADFCTCSRHLYYHLRIPLKVKFEHNRQRQSCLNLTTLTIFTIITIVIIVTIEHIRDNLVLISPGDLPLVEGPHPHSHLDCLVGRHPGFFCKITSCSVGHQWPRFAKKLFFPGFLLPRCQGWQGQQVYWKAQGRSVSPGAIGQPQHCLQAQLRSAQGSRGSSYMSN